MHVPRLGDDLPQRGNAFSRWAGRSAMRLLRWRFEGEPPNRARMVAIVAPHTSNWDFFVGLAAMFALGIRVRFLGKHSIFRPPAAGLLRWLGGIPVKRDERRGVVTEAAALFEKHDRLTLALSPEGTRKKTERWRTGFYHIACRANVPILMIGFDYGARRVAFGPLITPSGDLERDLAEMRAFFAPFRGRWPDQH